MTAIPLPEAVQPPSATLVSFLFVGNVVLLALLSFTCSGVVVVIRRERNEYCYARQKDLTSGLICSLSVFDIALPDQLVYSMVANTCDSFLSIL